MKVIFSLLYMGFFCTTHGYLMYHHHHHYPIWYLFPLSSPHPPPLPLLLPSSSLTIHWKDWKLLDSMNARRESNERLRLTQTN